MIPLKDYNPVRSRPFVTIALIAACIGIYFLIQPTGQATLLEADTRRQQIEELRFNFSHAAIPCELTRGRPLSEEEVVDTVERGDPSACEERPDTPAAFPGKNVFLAVLYSMFLHGSLMHLAGNMLFLWIFGNNIEDKRGRVTYVVFYLLAGVAATLAQVLLDPSSTIPMVGASGAIAGVMGAYLVLYPNVPIRTAIILGFFFLIRDLEAKWLLGLWFVSQFFIGPNAGVAYMAHVGGFVFGVLAGLLWRAMSPPPPPVRSAWTY